MRSTKRRESAGIVQLVEHLLAKEKVASSSLAARSFFYKAKYFFMATWPSGKARVCKTLIIGSNPIVASKIPFRGFFYFKGKGRTCTCQSRPGLARLSGRGRFRLPDPRGVPGTSVPGTVIGEGLPPGLFDSTRVPVPSGTGTVVGEGQVPAP